MGKNSVICSNCTGNKGIVVVMASKMAYKVCIWVNGQQSSVSASSKILEFFRVSDWEMFRWGLFSGPNFEPEGRLPPLRYQKATVLSISGRVSPVMLRVRFCIAVKASTA